MLDRRFPRNGKICDEPVSDSLKTFSATIERSDHGGKYLRSFIVIQQSLTSLSMIRGVNEWKEVILSECYCLFSFWVLTRAEGYACEPY